ncbi:MAG: mechanosensitive ion channel domain-containing protein [Snowella sp.]|nr:mechanosensitive ion channel domain-containing protein [Snowella sp.]
MPPKFSSWVKFIIIILGIFWFSITIPQGLASNIDINARFNRSSQSPEIIAELTTNNTSGQSTEPKKDNNISPVPITFDGKVLFTIKTRLGETSPKERVRSIHEKLVRIANDDTIPLDSIRIVDINHSQNWQLIQAGDMLLMVVTLDDAKVANKPILVLAEDYVKQFRVAVQNYRDSRQSESRLKGIIQAIVATILASFILYVVNRFLPRVLLWISDKSKRYFQNINSQIFFFLPPKQLAKLISFSLNALRIFLILFIFYLYIPFVLSSFPETKAIGITLLTYFWAAVNYIWNAFVGYLPNLFIVALIVAIAYYSISFSQFFFKTIERGNISIPNFYPEWAEPTANLVKILIFSLALVLIFPYLPAATSKSFQGVSIFLGALVTFGSTSIIGNVVSGIVLIYTRAFQLEDIIQVNDQRGKVIEKGMLSTRILTPDNEVITIPNGSLLVSSITNYSVVIRDRRQPLLLKTTVTLGYDLPWRKVHQTLINAAKATEGILNEPEPFVLQTSLDDFYVSYTLKAFTNQPEMMPLIYSCLHQNIQDQCNESDIEIMSPHYSSLRDGNQSTIPAEYLQYLTHSQGEIEV